MSKPFTYWIRLALVATLCTFTTFSPALAGRWIDRLLHRDCKPECCTTPVCGELVVPACEPTVVCDCPPAEIKSAPHAAEAETHAEAPKSEPHAPSRHQPRHH